MGKALVTIIGLLGVALAMWVVWGGRGVRTPAPRIAPDAPLRDRLREAVRQTAGLAAAGLVGGFISLGLGARLLMRILAATSPDAAGRGTDAGEVVGEVTLDGTMFLVGFLSFFGVFAALAFNFARPMFPHRTVVAGLVAAAIGGAIVILPSNLLDPGNRDFRILEPTWLAVLLCVAVIALTGPTIAVLADRAVASWPAPAWSVKGVAALVPLVACVPPPMAVAAVVFIATRTIRWPELRLREGIGPHLRRLVLAGGITGAAWIGVNAGRILV